MADMPLWRTAFGSLSCVVFDAAASGAPCELVVVLCHGFGAPGDDLVPIGPELCQRFPALAGRVRFVFPAAPLSLDFGFGDSRAWWLIDIDRIVSRGATPQGLRELRQEIPEGLPFARKLLRGLVDELLRTTGLPVSRLVLGGFSQGAMLATDLALRLDEPVSLLAVFSGTLVCEAEWRQRAPSRRGLPVLLSHGRQDPILPFEGAEALREVFVEAGLQVEFIPFDGPHTIGQEALDRFGRLLEARLPAR